MKRALNGVNLMRLHGGGPIAGAGNDVGRIAGNAELVVAQIAFESDIDADACAKHVEFVVSLGPIRDQLFDVAVAYRQSAAEDAVLGDDELVGEFGADDAQRVIAVATVHIDGSVDDVLDQVAIRSAVHIGIGRSFIGKCPNGKRVVAVVAGQVERGRVVEYGELVITVIAVDGRGKADAITQV